MQGNCLFLKGPKTETLFCKITVFCKFFCLFKMVLLSLNVMLDFTCDRNRIKQVMLLPLFWKISSFQSKISLVFGHVLVGACRSGMAIEDSLPVLEWFPLLKSRCLSSVQVTLSLKFHLDIFFIKDQKLRGEA